MVREGADITDHGVCARKRVRSRLCDNSKRFFSGERGPQETDGGRGGGVYIPELSTSLIGWQEERRG